MQDLLLLHGALGSKDQFTALSEKLSHNYKIHTLDFSGHGGKMFPIEDFSIPLFADEVLGYLHQEHLEKVHIFGYSMGGYVAMYLAKNHPELVDRIITLATKFYWDMGVAADEARMLDPLTIQQRLPAFATQLIERHQPNDWRDVLDKTKLMLLQLGEKNTLSLEDYSLIHNPTLLLLGEKDKMVTVDETMAVQEVLPNAAFKIIPGTPHQFEGVKTEMLAELIDSFIRTSI
jgi:pimeloyl-ACP methyl ester carboxylesterase